MKKYGKALTQTAWTLLIVFLLIGVSKIKNPYFLYIVLTGAVIFWVCNIYIKAKYRRGNADYLLIPTANDQYYKLSAIIIGVLILAVSVTAIVITEGINNWETMGIIIGVLLLLNGLLSLPGAVVKVDKNRLEISGLKEEKALEHLNNITCYNHALVIENIEGEKTQINNLNLDQKTVKLVKAYLEKRGALSLAIIDNTLPALA